jgi:hypothetical protein
MAQRLPFDLTKVSTADKILLGGSLLLFIDSLLAWQKQCPSGNCVADVNAWGGNAAFAGVLMGLFSFLLLVGVVLRALDVAMPPGVPVSTVMGVLTAGTILLGIIKFLFVLGNHPRFGAWIGLILIVTIAYGGYMKMQEEKATPPGSDSGFAP